MTRIGSLLLAAACARGSTPAPAPVPVDVRLEIVEAPEPPAVEGGVGIVSAQGFLVVPRLGLREKIFSVPTPYSCAPTPLGLAREDAGADLTAYCVGDDGMGFARVGVDGDRLVVRGLLYGRGGETTRETVPLPRGAIVKLVPPKSYPAPAVP